MREEPKKVTELSPADIERAKRQLLGGAAPRVYAETPVGARAAAASSDIAETIGENLRLSGGSQPDNDVEILLLRLLGSSALPLEDFKPIEQYFNLGTLSDTLEVAIHLASTVVAELAKGNQVIIQDKKGGRKALVIKFDDTESE
jgi:hypothetical protein